MANLVNLNTGLKVWVLCLICIATTSECTNILGTNRQMNFIREEHSIESGAVDKRLPRAKEITPEENYISCQQFFKRDLCDECFVVDNRAWSEPNNVGTTGRGEDQTVPAMIHELTRLGSALAAKLDQGACALGRSTLGRVRRSTAVVGDIHVNASSFVEAIYEKYGTSGVISETEFEGLLKDLGIGTPLDTTPQPSTNTSSSNGDYSAVKQCFSAVNLIDIFNASVGIPEEQFASICPSLIQQITEGCVAPVAPPTELDVMMYAWATLAVACITILSMLAMVAVPTHGSRFYAAVMQLFVALAVSSLSGDALLHLLPEALGIHAVPKTEGQPNHILIILTIILAVYFFFIFERVMSLCLRGKPYGHGHVHSRPRRETFVEDDVCETTLEAIKEISDRYNRDDFKAEGKADGKKEIQDTISMKNVEEETSKKKKLDMDEDTVAEVPNKQEQKIFGLNMLSVMVLMGDVVHNVTDGITIGVSFVNGPFAGISTSIAVFFHEVPHEIGDFAVMLRSGVSFRKAMLCSLVSNLVGFAGLYTGLLLGSENVVQRWIFAATAGMFMYIALVSLVPEMNQQAEEAGRNPWRVFLRHNIGLLLGWTVMLGLGVYEQYSEDLF